MHSLLTHPTAIQAILEGIFICFIGFHASWFIGLCLILFLIGLVIARLFVLCFSSKTGPKPLHANPKTIFITGGGSTAGIGFALAKEYVSHGAATIILTDINESALSTAASDLQTHHQAVLAQSQSKKSTPTISPTLTVVTQVVDVTDQAKMSQIMVHLDDIYSIDIVVANAGIAPHNLSHLSFEEMTRKTHEINTTGVMNTIFPLKNVFRSRKSGSQFIIISSASSFFPLAGTAYPASKAWATQFGRTLRQELAFENVSVVTICPGFVDTPLLDKVSRDYTIWRITPQQLARRVIVASQNDESLCVFPTWRWFALYHIFWTIGFKLMDYIAFQTKIREPCSDLLLDEVNSLHKEKLVIPNNVSGTIKNNSSANGQFKID